MQQKNIQIGNMEVPIIIDGGEEWFPVSYLCEKVLLRKGKIKFNTKYINTYVINYEFCAGGIQEVKCVSKDGIIEYVNTIRLGRMNVDQRKNFNELMSYLCIDIKVSEKKQFIHNPSKDIKNQLDLYELNVYSEIKSELDDDCWQRCTKCDTYYPFHINFFRENQSSPNKLNTFCRKCGWTESRLKDHFKHPNKELEKIYVKYGLNIFLKYNNHDTIEIYNHYVNNNLHKFPEILKNKNDYLVILKYLKSKGLIDRDKLNMEYLMETHRLNHIRTKFTLHEVYQIILGEKYYLKFWEYPRVTVDQFNITYEIANQILNNYIKIFKIKIDNILTFNYEEILKKSKLYCYAAKDYLYFLVQFYNFQYPGYKFRCKTTNYYKSESNVLFDLKYLIEQDMKLNIDKIPLYLTKYVLQKKCSSLYNYIVSNKHGSIYEWVDKLYPSKFCREDFEINPYRNEFDSDTEAFIHELLAEEFGSNVIYNQRNNQDTVKLKSKIPDWFIFTDKGVWVVEYFGMLDERYTENSRIRDYKEKVKDKISLYEELKGYDFLYLYKSDIDNDYEGIRKKIINLKESLDT